jgi:hypothetical protein
MSEPLDWNAKTIAEFRANAGRIGGNFEGARQHGFNSEVVTSATAGSDAWASMKRRPEVPDETLQEEQK